MNVALLTRIDPIQPLHRITGTANVLQNMKKTRSTGISKNFVGRFSIPVSPKKNLKFSLFGLHLRSFPERLSNAAARSAQASLVVKAAQQEAELGFKVIVAGDLNDYDYELVGCTTDFRSQTLSQLRCAAGGLTNPLGMVPSVRRHSSTRGSLIDYILLDKTLQVNSADIFNERKLSASDHYPVIVELDCKF